MVERNVLGSNSRRFLAATAGVMSGPLSRVPNANKATSHDVKMNKCARRTRMIAGKTCDPLDENNDFTRGVESQTFPLLPFLAHCVLPSDGALGSYVPVYTGLTGV